MLPSHTSPQNTPQNLPKVLKARWQIASATAFCSILLSSTLLYASPPAWWNTRGVIDENAQEENYAVVNVGQAKWMATQAYAELSVRLAPFGGVDFQLSDIIPDIPENPDALWYEQQKAVLNLGQLKAMALPFYDSLNQRLPGFLDYQAQINGIPWEAGQTYPWNPDTPVEQNFGPVNIGQLKSTFAFQFDADLDGNGVPDFSSFGVPTQPLGGDSGGGSTGGGSTGGGGNPAPRPDRDNDGVPDDEDGWAFTSVLSPERIEVANYVAVELTSLPKGSRVNNFDINNKSNAILAVTVEGSDENDSQDDQHFAWSYFDGSLQSIDGSYEFSFVEECKEEEESKVKAFKYRSFTEEGYYLRFGENIHLCKDSGGAIKLLKASSFESTDLHITSSFQANVIDPGGIVLGSGSISIKLIDGEPVDLEFICEPDEEDDKADVDITGFRNNLIWKDSAEASGFTDVINTVTRSVFETESISTFGSGSIVTPFLSNKHGVKIGLATIYNKYKEEFDFDTDTLNKSGSAKREFSYFTGAEFNALVEQEVDAEQRFSVSSSSAVKSSQAGISNRNTIVLKQEKDSDATTLWIDQNAGHRHDKEVNSSPNYQEIEWNPSWGAAPPVNLNANMQGFGANRSGNEGSVWMNGQWHNLIGENLIDASIYSDVQIHDINDNGTLAAVLEKPNGAKVAALLLPVDLDIVHPATGELEERKQNDQTRGGYVAVRRDDKTPVTNLVIRKGAAIDGMKYRLKLNAGANFKIWKDGERTQAVISEQTEFEPDEETTLYFEGLKKSDSIGQHDITLQAVINGESQNIETVYTSVVEAEFDVWINIFIPVQWADYPAIHPIHTDWIRVGTGVAPIFRRKIAGGDDRGFNNRFFENPLRDVDDIDNNKSSRVHAQVTLIPFKELDEDGVKGGSQKNFIGETFNFLKNESVPNPSEGYSETNRLFTEPEITQQGRAEPTKVDEIKDTIFRDPANRNDLIFSFSGSADNPIVNPSPAIDWDFQIIISVSGLNVLTPKWALLGNKQDAFPAYEIYVRDSDGSDGDNLGTAIYQYDPIPLGRTPADLFEEPFGDDQPVDFDRGLIP